MRRITWPWAANCQIYDSNPSIEQFSIIIALASNNSSNNISSSYLLHQRTKCTNVRLS
jgi:hypothetical protein